MYNREEAVQAVRRNPDSFLAVDRAETAFGPEVDTYAPEVYRKAASLLESRIREGQFVREERPVFYRHIPYAAAFAACPPARRKHSGGGRPLCRPVEEWDRPCSPERKGVFGMYLGEKWYRLAAKPHLLSQDAVDGLDVSLLQNHLLGP